MDSDRINAIKRRYLDSFSDKLIVLKQYQQQIDVGVQDIAFSEIATFLHQLAGSAGMYEFADIAKFAKSAEMSAKTAQPQQLLSDLKTISLLMNQELNQTE